MLADLNYAIRGNIIQEPLKVENENGWKHLDVHLLARLSEARWTELYRLQVRDACECVFHSVHRIVLLDCVDVSLQRNGKREGRTWMSSWSDRQFSMMAVSGWFGARTVERNFPPNMRVKGDSTDTAYSWPYIHQQFQAWRAERWNNWRTVKPSSLTPVGTDRDTSGSSTPGAAAADLWLIEVSSANNSSSRASRWRRKNSSASCCWPFYTH